MACITSKENSVKTVEVDGYFGKEKHYILPIPEHPPLIKDIYGWEWLILGDTDEEFYRVAKPLPNGEVDIVTLGHKRKDSFPDLDSDYHVHKDISVSSDRSG